MNYQRPTSFWSVYCWLASFALVAFMTGCEPWRPSQAATDEMRSSPKSVEGKAGHAQKSSSWDIGVMLVDQEGYLCVPLSRWEIENGKNVVATRSTCDCIQPSIVTFVGADGVSEPGLLLTYHHRLAETGSSSTEFPLRLRVVIEIELSSGRKLELPIDLLSTRLLKEPG